MDAVLDEYASRCASLDLHLRADADVLVRRWQSSLDGLDASLAGRQGALRSAADAYLDRHAPRLTRDMMAAFQADLQESLRRLQADHDEQVSALIHRVVGEGHQAAQAALQSAVADLQARWQTTRSQLVESVRERARRQALDAVADAERALRDDVDRDAERIGAEARAEIADQIQAERHRLEQERQRRLAAVEQRLKDDGERRLEAVRREAQAALSKQLQEVRGRHQRDMAGKEKALLGELGAQAAQQRAEQEASCRARAKAHERRLRKDIDADQARHAARFQADLDAALQAQTEQSLKAYRCKVAAEWRLQADRMRQEARAQADQRLQEQRRAIDADHDERIERLRADLQRQVEADQQAQKQDAERRLQDEIRALEGEFEAARQQWEQTIREAAAGERAAALDALRQRLETRRQHCIQQVADDVCAQHRRAIDEEWARHARSTATAAAPAPWATIDPDLIARVQALSGRIADLHQGKADVEAPI